MDRLLLEYLNDLAGESAVFDAVALFLSSYLQYGIGAALLIVASLPVRRFRMAAAALAAAVVARGLLKPLILLFVHRPRPYVALTDIHNIVGPQIGEEYQSFPSGHAVFFFALAMAVYLHDRKLGYWFFGGAVVMGVARVIGGIHWPSDIVGGAIIGILTAWLLVRLVPALRPRTTE